MPSLVPASTVTLTAKSLCKSFGKGFTVGPLSFSLAMGSTTGLLGGNGAGKTTTIGMIMGLIEPTSGSICVFGYDMAHERHSVLGRMNFECPYVDMPHRLTVRQNLRVFARLYGVIDMERKIARLAEDLALVEFLDRASGSLSAGQKTRMALAKTLINEPELLLLDEPTASLGAGFPNTVAARWAGPQPGKIFAQVRMYDEKRRQISIGEKVPSDGCRRVDIVQRRSKSHPCEIPSNSSAWATRRVGDELEWNLRRLYHRNRVERAR